MNSLLLTWLLIFHSPNNSTVSLSEYLPRITFGSESEIQQIIKPTKIIYHLGENRHSLSTPGMESYQKIELDMNHWAFYDFYLVYYGVDWREMIEDKNGIEIIFPHSLSASLLSSMFKVTNTSNKLDSINRIWLSVDNVDNVRAYFISDEEDKVFVSQTSISSQKLTQYTAYSFNQKKYAYYWSSKNETSFIKQTYYLPKEDLEMKLYRQTYNPVSVGDFIQLLFIDPIMVRKVYEQNNNQNVIYTDGTRSIQYYPNEKYIRYYQPVSDNETEIDINKDAFAAIRFVNHHGGWDGNYYLDKINKMDGASRTAYLFRQYIDGYPIIKNESNYGMIQMQVKDGIINQFQRSMLLLDKSVEVKRVEVMKDIELIQLLEQRNISMGDIKNIELGYKIIETHELLNFTPYWQILLSSDLTIEIPAYESVVHEFGLE